jgi:triosephosphate isomerase
MTKSLLFVANWKMSMPFHAACSFVQDNKHELEKLAAPTGTTIVLCPSFVALDALVKMVHNMSIYIGAQNCSDHLAGAFTGEVDAQSLQQINCSYCIIGHSERRSLFRETSEEVAQKAKFLLEHTIIPIICIGETKEQYEAQQTFDILEKQLAPVWQVIDQPTNVVIAYEPVWSIGTGIIPEKEYLQKIFDWLSKQCSQYLSKMIVQLIYGGSVDQNNAKDLAQIAKMDGFLIGGASLDFQKFKNIVLLSR